MRYKIIYVTSLYESRLFSLVQHCILRRNKLYFNRNIHEIAVRFQNYLKWFSILTIVRGYSSTESLIYEDKVLIHLYIYIFPGNFLNIFWKKFSHCNLVNVLWHIRISTIQLLLGGWFVDMILAERNWKNICFK